MGIRSCYLQGFKHNLDLQLDLDLHRHHGLILLSEGALPQYFLWQLTEANISTNIAWSGETSLFEFAGPL